MTGRGRALALSLACLLSASCLSGAGEQRDADGPTGTGLEDSAGRGPMQLRLETLSGDELDMMDLEGKVVLVDVWATWCAPCRRALPGLSHLASTRSQQLAVIGLSVDHDKRALEAFLSKQALPYPVVHAGPEAARVFEARSLPTLYVLDPTGRHVDTLVGELPEASLLAVLSKYFSR